MTDEDHPAAAIHDRNVHDAARRIRRIFCPARRKSLQIRVGDIR